MKFLLYFFPSVGKLMVGLQWGDATVLFFFLILFLKNTTCLVFLIYIFITCIFIWLYQIFIMALEIFSCRVQNPSCSMWDLVPQPGIKPRPLALGVQSLSPWTTREVPRQLLSVECAPLNTLWNPHHQSLWQTPFPQTPPSCL